VFLCFSKLELWKFFFSIIIQIVNSLLDSSLIRNPFPRSQTSHLTAVLSCSCSLQYVDSQFPRPADEQMSKKTADPPKLSIPTVISLRPAQSLKMTLAPNGDCKEFGLLSNGFPSSRILHLPQF
jgi:hypothetical protein